MMEEVTYKRYGRLSIRYEWFIVGVCGHRIAHYYVELGGEKLYRAKDERDAALFIAQAQLGSDADIELEQALKA